jgi:hypothetical protein
MKKNRHRRRSRSRRRRRSRRRSRSRSRRRSGNLRARVWSSGLIPAGVALGVASMIRSCQTIVSFPSAVHVEQALPFAKKVLVAFSGKRIVGMAIILNHNSMTTLDGDLRPVCNTDELYVDGMCSRSMRTSLYMLRAIKDLASRERKKAIVLYAPKNRSAMLSRTGFKSCARPCSQRCALADVRYSLLPELGIRFAACVR